MAPVATIRSSAGSSSRAAIQRIRDGPGCSLQRERVQREVRRRRIPNVKAVGIKYTQFDVFNTVNYDYNVLVPTLTSEQFKRLYLDVVRMKVE